ncbi:HesA/MoeB/ThiF family protein [Marinoscillum sp. MHG1-6]|uniref:HesA/MoeB/ThiF family protein n=1 Tax=Marinoscillum sp. MHG1-6 TaxID=2959627 RepID=UPI0021580A3B|nr:HesA/MoeB/ThiF family protein [Marinoscillum sp. MHG1-6]
MTLSAREKDRYSRHILLENIGLEGQLKLKSASVLMIGAGGLGCPTLQYLSAAGIGKIGIIDEDKVSRSNLQRQILYTEQDIGQLKVDVAKQRLEAMNPDIEISTYPEALNASNAISLFEEYDLIVEGSDNFTTKYLANDAAVLTGKTLVMASIFKYESQLSVYNYQNGPTYRCLFPKPMNAQEMPTCSEVGVMGVITGITGGYMANEVLKIILGTGDVLSGKLLSLNTLSMDNIIFPFEKDPAIQVQKLETINLICAAPTSQIAEVDYSDYEQNQEVFSLLDVRNAHEREVASLGGLHIPLNEISKRYTELEDHDSILVYCASGKRSEQAIQQLQQLFPDKRYYNLTGGMARVRNGGHLPSL